MDRRIKKKILVSYHEARTLLEPRIKEESVLDIQVKTWEYLKIFGDRSPEEARRILEELLKLGIKDVVAVNILNICPSSEGEVRSILSMDKEASYPLDIPEKILAVIRDYCSQQAGKLGSLRS